jgi:hypothetical protein
MKISSQLANNFDYSSAVNSDAMKGWFHWVYWTGAPQSKGRAAFNLLN